MKALSALLDNPTTVEGSRPQASKGLRTRTNQEQLRIPELEREENGRQSNEQGGRKKPDHPGTPAPDQGRQRSKRALRLPHLCRTTNTLPVMKPLSHGLTLASSTGFGGVGSGFSQLSVQGPQHGSLGKVGAGATAPPPFQARPTKGAGSEHPAP